MKQVISSLPNGLKTQGPYSLGVIAQGKFLFIAGQGPYNVKTGKFERGTVEEQTELTLNNIKAIIEAAGGSMENVVSCRVFLQPNDMQIWERMNAVYKKFFGSNFPVRTTVGCQLLHIDVEIDCIAVLD